MYGMNNTCPDYKFPKVRSSTLAPNMLGICRMVTQMATSSSTLLPATYKEYYSLRHWIFY